MILHLFFVFGIGCIENFPDPPYKKIIDVPNEDYDGDGFSEIEGDVYPDGSSADNDPDMYPGAPDICDGKDNDLNGVIDDNIALHTEFFTDSDQDGFGVEETRYIACIAASETDIPFQVNRNDCNDNDRSVYPGHLNNEDFGCYLDNDHDGFGDMNAQYPYDIGTDCEDNDKNIYPSNARYEPFGSCVRDSDGDGYGDILAEFPLDVGRDCDDSNVLVYPGSLLKEFGNGCYRDVDGDGFGDQNPPEHYDMGTDCVDSDPNIHSNAIEICDGLDNNCNSFIDGLNQNGEQVEIPIDGFLYFVDADGDGYGGQTGVLRSCEATPPLGLSLSESDCDDTDASIYPSALEICDDIDQDCNGENRDNYAIDAPYWYLDSDNDGYGDAGIAIRSCASVDGYANNPDDCADGSNMRYPQANELCNTVDDDCDGLIDEEGSVDAPVWYFDNDNDGFAGSAITIQICTAPDGFLSQPIDCNDVDQNIHPEAIETCDGIDNNCDDNIDGEDATNKSTWYADSDNDGFGTILSVTYACTIPNGYVEDNSDCDDNDSNQNPLASELCSTEEDDDCDGFVNEDSAADAYTYYQDADNDGFGVSFYTKLACSIPQGYTESYNDGWDCNDNDPLAKPGLTEYCNSKDDDCDGLIDELFYEDPDSPAQDTVLFYTDHDGDGFGALGSDPDSYACPDDVEDATRQVANNNFDCDDDNELIHPNANEVCDQSVDMNCDGNTTLGAIDPKTWFVDSDRDGFGDPNVSFVACTAPSGFIEDNSDCSDLDSEVYPNAIELCNGTLDNCLSNIEVVEEAWFVEDQLDFEEGINVPVRQIPINEWDHDGDHSVDCIADIPFLAWKSSQKQMVDENGNYVSGLLQGNDCDDTRSYVYPNAPETCNGRHDDCEEFLSLGDIPADEFDDDHDGFIDCERDTPLPIDENGQPEWFGEFFDADENGISDNLEVIDGNYYPIDGDCNDNDEYTYPGAAYLTSTTECLQDAYGPNGIEEPDGLCDCLYGECDYGIYLDEGIGIDFKIIEGDDLINTLTYSSEIFSFPFYIMTTEVTQGMFQHVMGYESQLDCDYYSCTVMGYGDQYPANLVTWHMAAHFANRLSELQDLETCYTCSGETIDVFCEDKYRSPYICEGYSLPTHKEWELIARSGTSSAFWTGQGETLGGNMSNVLCSTEDVILDGINNYFLYDFAWYCANNSRNGYPNGMKEVAQKLPNGFDLFDTIGNVAEHTSSAYYSTDVIRSWLLQETSDTIVKGGGYSSMGFTNIHGNPTTPKDYRGLGNGFRLRRLLVKDVDGDGITSLQDCNDDDPNAGSNVGDIDCDGISSENDCNDYNASITLQISEDSDCDPSTAE